MTALLTTQTTDLASSAIDYASSTTIAVVGTLAGAVVVIEVSPDGGTTWVVAEVLERLGVVTLTLSGTFKFRARLLSAAATTSVTVTYNGAAA